MAYVALGSNLGNREENIRAAIRKLTETVGIELVRVSTFLENAAVGGPEQSPSFINAVAKIRTTLPARTLLHHLLKIEKELGRVRREKWEPRVVDLDLILYGEQVIECEELIVPHPLMHQRLFVLEPLAELQPELIHPILKKSMAVLLHELGARAEQKM